MLFGSILVLGLVGGGIWMLIIMFGAFFQMSRYKKEQDAIKREIDKPLTKEQIERKLANKERQKNDPTLKG